MSRWDRIYAHRRARARERAAVEAQRAKMLVAYHVVAVAAALYLQQPTAFRKKALAEAVTQLQTDEMFAVGWPLPEEADTAARRLLDKARHDR